MKGRWPITLMCEVLEVSPSGYFGWEAAGGRNGPGPSRSLSDEALLAHMRAVHEQVAAEYGWPRMHKELLARGHRVGKERDALLMACFRRHPPSGLIFHSDRGSQYCSDDFQATLKAWSMRSSMSRKGNCWDNAPTESLWGRLKTACVHGRRFHTRDQARQAVMDWLAFYNHSRLHSALGYVSPMQYEQRWLAAQLKSAA